MISKFTLPVLFCILFVFGASLALKAQQNNIPFTQMGYSQWESKLYEPNSGAHTSIRPFRASDVDALVNRDSFYNTFYNRDTTGKSKFMRKLRHENLLIGREGASIIKIDPVIQFESGKDLVDGKKTFVNTRGIMITGNLGPKFSFFTSFLENQASFPVYMDSFVKFNGVIPGQGRVVSPTPASYDFANATGYISYSPNKIFNFQFGHDRNFIGDGYRSLLLSDNTIAYPALKITTTFWKIRYLNLMTSMMDARHTPQQDQGFTKKYVNLHYLSLNATKRLNFGLFESITWGGASRGLELSYLNPLVFYHPIAFGDQSAANIMLGLTTRYSILKNLVVYSQLMMDEFRIQDVLHRNGWWGNKQGVQAGVKYYNAFHIKNLFLQYEFNYVRPYSYQYASTLGSYENYNQPLAHPVGANFFEHVGFLRYRYKMWGCELRGQYLIYGDDDADYNHGRRTSNLYNVNRFADFGIKTLSGIQNVITSGEARLQYFVNPVTGLVLEAGVMMRNKTVQDQATQKTNWVFLGLKTYLFNRYYDF